MPSADPARRCPRCGSEVAAGDQFCEACGAEIVGAAPPVPAGPPAGQEAPIELSRPVRPTQDRTPAGAVGPARPCVSCGGVVAADGYCETCGAKEVSERDHFVESPAPWVAGICDRGISHHRNEDAMALAADPAPGTRAVLVVCDGVSTSTDSDVASLAGAKAAREVLVANRPAGLGTHDSRVAALQRSLGAAATAANQAVVDTSVPAAELADDSSASATLVAAVLDGSLLVAGCIGDSRAYWLPDRGHALILTTDDSVAQVRIAAGVPREEAENGPQAHAITRWLGRDAPDVVPTCTATDLDASGWVLVCSDGLWNYASEAAQLQALLSALVPDVAAAAPLDLADALVRWACEQGGKDNITVTLARFAP
ncbi:MAG: double zinc ribbon domain-containing protein [Propionibacteriaceae bacterium]